MPARVQRAHGRPHRAVAQIRSAVRAALLEARPAPVADQPLALAAVSGGADSLALADALAFVHDDAGWRAGALIVDHDLQPGSAPAAETAARICRTRGLDPVEIIRVQVPDSGTGPEAAAREVRYAALTAAADRLGAATVLLGHTRDDQAEQVLLGLTRGSGTRSLSGMRRSRGLFARPLLGTSRADTRAACAAENLEVWDDPMNADPAFTRVRVRRLLADLEEDLGPGVAAALARSAEQLRADADLLDDLARRARAGLPERSPFSVAELAALAAPLRLRVWRLLLTDAGAPAGRTGATHTNACDRLLTDWRGQGPTHVPGGLSVSRREGWVHIETEGRVE